MGSAYEIRVGLFSHTCERTWTCIYKKVMAPRSCDYYIVSFYVIQGAPGFLYARCTK